MQCIRSPLIIGKRGQLSHALLAALPGAVATSHREGSKPYLDLSNLPPDSQQIDALLETFDSSEIYCCGALTDVDGCEREPVRALKTNSDGPSRLAAGAARARVPFVYFSSDYVFDGSGGPYGEDAVPNPLNVYGTSKRDGELAVLAANPRALVIRTTGVYGLDPRRMNFIYTVRRALVEGREISVANDQLGTPTYAPDLAAAANLLVRCGVQGVIHVAGPEMLSREAYARRIVRFLGGSERAVISRTTRSLRQLAERPLRGGLRTLKLQKTLPDFSMLTIEDALDAWSQNEPGLLLRHRCL